MTLLHTPVAFIGIGNMGLAMALRLREDVVNDGGIADAVLGNAPDRNGEYFAVPKVVE